jgi:thiosulfate dehydrogenase (quinone) large subunit
MTGQPRRTQPSRSDSPWLRRRAQPGWLLLPLRAFLGLTFCYAGLQKLANPGYLDAHNPTSVAHQMLLLRHRSPIGPLLGLSMHAPTLVGLLIAFSELAVGVGTLLGLWARVAAAGGALLALTFFLTVSWNTSPYYYGADIVFVFAWLVMLAFGSGGVLSADAWLRKRARRDLGLGPEPATVDIAVPRLRKLCGRGSKCGLAPDGQCTRLAGCPVFPVGELLPADRRDELGRRTVVIGGVAAAAVGILAILAGGLTAFIGRALGGTSRRSRAALSPTKTTTGSASTPTSTSSSTTSGSPAAPGVAVARASSISIGQALSFTDPANGNPAWVVHPSATTFVAFSAVCTHTGCPVQYDPSTIEFICPCHGGTYDARTGQVLQGPPPAPLPSIPLHVIDGQIRVG